MPMTMKGLAGIAGAMLCAGGIAGCRAAAAPRRSGPDVRTVITHALPPLDGHALAATVVEVAYGPGGSSPPHSHACPVIGYVLEGALRSQVKGEAEAVYRTGESFYEAPDGIHAVSANASATKPVRFLAYFVCDTARGAHP